MSEFKLQKPFLKWVGGKTQIINAIIAKVPNVIDNYHEIFLGGGSVLLALLSLQRQNKIVINKKIYAYDINGQLINVYKQIQQHKDELYSKISVYMSQYDSIKGSIVNRNPTTLQEALTSQESYYYWLRKQYNNIDNIHSIDCAALFMVINKTCFRGMYREGPNGYNVPFGHYKKTPTVITKEAMNVISDLIKDVDFVQSDFNKSLLHITPGDFVYLDPPYAPETSTSFVGYNKDGFGLESHNKLFTTINELKDKKIKFVMSNAKVELVENSFKDCSMDDIVARRAINPKNPGSTTTEVIVYN
jgi:DNA adenine methylase